ncbi:hypothetical protein MNVM_36270 [Mycobacterium novum]|uniref:Uncharacterized protein n=1 Tax=Mycobacterium novum TaxID=2492438 RepID=A0A7I7JRT4_9MYCO|nr:hypothetical protein MNVM_36270 [Mycobacterium novum]
MRSPGSGAAQPGVGAGPFDRRLRHVDSGRREAVFGEVDGMVARAGPRVENRTFDRAQRDQPPHHRLGATDVPRCGGGQSRRGAIDLLEAFGVAG